MSYLLAVMAKSGGAKCFRDSTADALRPGLTLENSHSLKLNLPGFFLHADIGQRHIGSLWVEEHPDPTQRSCVVAFDWCYKMGMGRHQLNVEDMAEILACCRQNRKPDLQPLSGIYCMLIYDHQSQSVWVCTDIWAQHGYYYGSNNELVIASSRAGVVADYLGAPIDGYSYVCHLRGNAIPPGRSLFSHVWRATCGKAVHFSIETKTARVIQLQSLFQPPEKMSLKEAINRYVGVATKVIPLAACEPNTCVDLSGGHDSRMTAAALTAYNDGEIARRVTFRVTGAPDHPDVITSKKVAATMGWKLVRNDRNIPFTNNEASLSRAALLSDGKFLLPMVLYRLSEEELEVWQPIIGLVGSIAGELFRDYVFRHELYHLGLKQKINYQFWLRHKLHAVVKVEMDRISQGKITIDDHNESQLNPYRELEKMLLPAHIYHRFDRFYFFKLMHVTWGWGLSDLRQVMTPYFSHEITRVSLSIPWYLKTGRMIVTAGVERMAPQIAVIPTANLGPMQPLRLKNLPAYTRWVYGDAATIYRRHFGKKKFTPVGPPAYNFDPLWLDLLLQGSFAKNLYLIESLLKTMENNQGIALNRIQYLEMQSLVLVEMLSRHYPNLTQRLDFDAPASPIAESEHEL